MGPARAGVPPPGCVPRAFATIEDASHAAWTDLGGSDSCRGPLVRLSLTGLCAGLSDA
jgi:hypothetical protein